MKEKLFLGLVLCFVNQFLAIKMEAGEVNFENKINWSEVDGSLYFENWQYEDSLLSIYPFKQDDIVFDIGASKGVWTALALRFAPFIDVYAFEPSEAYSSLDLMNIYSAERLFNYAISNQVGSDVFFALEGESAFLSGLINRPLFSKGYKEIMVPTDTVDHFCEERGIKKIEYLKIDTEGAELRILQGAKKMLSEHNIKALQFEYGETFYDAKITLKQVIQLLTQAGYAVFRIDPCGLAFISSWEDSLENYQYLNFFAILYSEVPKCKVLSNL